MNRPTLEVGCPTFEVVAPTFEVGAPTFVVGWGLGNVFSDGGWVRDLPPYLSLLDVFFDFMSDFVWIFRVWVGTGRDLSLHWRD